jgi:hypothetical protein
MVNEKLIRELVKVRDKKKTVEVAYFSILDLLGEKELGVSDETTKHGALHDVRKSEGGADVLDKESGSSVEITLGNRIEDEKAFCSFCKNEYPRNQILTGGICMTCQVKPEIFIAK